MHLSKKTIFFSVEFRTFYLQISEKFKFRKKKFEKNFLTMQSRSTDKLFIFLFFWHKNLF